MPTRQVLQSFLVYKSTLHTLYNGAVQAIKRFIRHYFLSPGTEINWYSTVAVLYFATHLFALTNLPVFADEAIYIRWTQLIIDEPVRYAFFPLNDGKTPLFIWAMLPFQYLFTDQLFAGRFVAVIFGFFQVLLTGAVVKKLGGSRLAEMIAMVMVTVLPYWFFHHRMALMDGLLTFWITLSFFIALSIQELVIKRTENSVECHCTIPSTLGAIFYGKGTLLVLAGAISFGAALWTKIPAILAIPALLIPVFWHPAKLLGTWIYRAIPLGAMIFGGLCVFLLLKLQPAFSQLFSRGGDFLYPVSEVLAGAWTITLQQIPTYLSYFVSYLSPGVMLLLVFGLFLPHEKRRPVVVLVLAGLSFMAPITLLGKVVYARYFLPAAPFFTIAAVVTIDSLLSWIRTITTTPAQKLQAKVVLTLTGLLMATTAVPYITASFFNPNTTPFVPTDRVQYLTEWSSGHGIKQAIDLLQTEAQTKRIAVATEGYFGTLPDAIVMYLHRRDVTNIWVDGIGQPVVSIPAKFTEQAESYDEVWLVVNSHRMDITLPKEKLKAEYCRPFNAPCLQVWDITEDLKRLTKY